MKRALKGLLASLLVLACLGIAAVGVLQATGWNLIWGQYLQAGDGSHIMIDRHGDPIILGDRSRTGNLFHGLRDGDTYYSSVLTFRRAILPAHGPIGASAWSVALPPISQWIRWAS